MPRYATVRIDLDIEKTEKFIDLKKELGLRDSDIDILDDIALWGLYHQDQDGLCPIPSLFDLSDVIPSACNGDYSYAIDSAKAMIKHGFITVENGKWRINVWKVLRIDADEQDDIGPAPSSENSTEANQGSETGILEGQEHSWCQYHNSPVVDGRCEYETLLPTGVGGYLPCKDWILDKSIPHNKAYVLDMSYMDGEEVNRISNGFSGFIDKYLVQGSVSGDVILNLKKS